MPIISISLVTVCACVGGWGEGGTVGASVL